MVDLIELVKTLSENFTKIINREVIKQYKELDWGDNGIGNRWAKKKFNYSVINKNGSVKIYSDNLDDTISDEIKTDFMTNNKTKSRGIIGIFVHSLKDPSKNDNRPIDKKIRRHFKNEGCVVCGSKSEIVVDHKNDMYNDPRVLNSTTQTIDDFQPLCNHCNLQKRQIQKDEVKTQILYSAKKLPTFRAYDFEFPWEKKNYDTYDIYCKKDTYWYDPVEFHNKISRYSQCTIPINKMVKQNIKLVL
jgi:5-methylcytosine-specific restriction endonuclease McrA